MFNFICGLVLGGVVGASVAAAIAAMLFASMVVARDERRRAMQRPANVRPMQPPMSRPLRK